MDNSAFRDDLLDCIKWFALSGQSHHLEQLVSRFGQVSGNESLRELAGALAGFGLFEQAYQVLSHIQEDWSHCNSWALFDIALAHLRYQQPDEAYAATSRIGHTAARLRGLSLLARYFRQDDPEVGRSYADEAGELAMSPSSWSAWDRDDRSRSLMEIAPDLFGLGSGWALAVCREAMTGVAREVPSYMTETVYRFLERLVVVGQGEAIRDALPLIRDPQIELAARSQMVRGLAADGRFEEAEREALAIENLEWREWAITWIALAAAEAGHTQLADRCSALISTSSAKCNYLSQLAVVFAAQGDARLGEVISRLQHHVEQVSDPKFTETLAERLAEAGQTIPGIRLLSRLTLDGFLTELARWQPCLEAIEQGLMLKALRLGAGLAAWMRTDWQDVHQSLNAAHASA